MSKDFTTKCTKDTKKKPSRRGTQKLDFVHFAGFVARKCSGVFTGLSA